MWVSEPIDNPLYRALVVRKNAEDLVDWVERARVMYSGLGAKFTGKPVTIRFPSGALIRMGHLKDDSTYTKYQGHEYHRMLLEELTQIQTEERYMKLISSCRSTVPELRPQIFATANPGGVGHLWVKQRFIDQGKQNYPFVGHDGLKRIYIPATIDDNPKLMEADPGYVKTLEALKDVDPALYRAWRFGDWDVFVGQVFTEWRQTLNGEPWHVISRLGITVEEFKAAKKYVGYDWGYNDPASAHWILLLPENEYGVRRMFIYREMYQGQLTPREWAYQLADVFKGEPIDHLVLPHDAYSHLGGNQTIVSVFEEVFNEVCGENVVSILRANSLAAGARMNRLGIMHQMLSAAPDGKPYLQVLDKCRNFIRTLPALPYSDTKPEDIDDKAEDHCLAGDTLVDTLYGQVKIKDLVGTEGFVWSIDGLRKFSDVRQTAIEKLYKITFDNGSVVRATSEHPFMTDNGWKKVIDLRPHDMIRLVYAGGYSKRDKTRVQWRTVLSFEGIKQLLHKNKQALQGKSKTTSNRLGIPQWEYTNRIPHSSQRPRQDKQSDRESGVIKRAQSFIISLIHPTSERENESTYREDTTQSYRVAQKRSGSGMAQETLQYNERETSLFALQGRKEIFYSLRDVWEAFLDGVSNRKEVQPNMYTSISRIEEEGEEPVYNLEVEGTHSFSVEGGILVHNCFDSSTYGLMTLLEHESMVIGETGVVRNTKKSYVASDAGIMEGFGLDVAKSIEKLNNKQQDWRYR